MRLVEALALFHEARNSRVLYHIGPRPAQPKPAHSRAARGEWQRPGRDPVSSGVFLSPDPFRVRANHGVFGHVYAYRVPEHVIRAAGGVRTFDNAAELLIPEHLWHHVEFLGKSLDMSSFEKSDRALRQRRSRELRSAPQQAKSTQDAEKLAAALERMKERPFVPRRNPSGPSEPWWRKERPKRVN